MAAHVNSLQTSWQAESPSKFGSFDDVRNYLGAKLSTDEGYEQVLAPKPDDFDSFNGDIPTDFDVRTAFPDCADVSGFIGDQSSCGSCWAFSASEVLSDRVAIAAGKASPVLSAEDMVSCDKSDMGCSGGMLNNAWAYLVGTGIVTDSCFPYTAGGGEAPACATTCVDSESFTKTKAKNSYAIKSVINMQKEIMTNGPIQVAFMVYKSFMSYVSGVYQKHWWELLPEGGHAVKIVGWGTEDGVDYWLVANSWNTSWGLSGFFKIKRGTDHCGIETRGPPYAGMPDMPSVVV